MAAHSVERIRKTVIELDENGKETGVTFVSQNEAKQYYRCSIVTLRKHIKNNTKLNGHNVYLKLGEITIRTMPVIECDKDGISTETSLKFESITEAARYYRSNFHAIKKIVDNKKEVPGFNVFLKLDEGEHEQ